MYLFCLYNNTDTSMKQFVRKVFAGCLAFTSVIFLLSAECIYAKGGNAGENLSGAVYKNIAYNNISTVQNMDIHIPARYAATKNDNGNSSTPYPSVIAIGNMYNGQPHGVSSAMQALEYGYVVIVPKYRNGIKESVTDIVSVLKWIRENGKKYKLDRDRIVLWGTSYGGYIAAIAGCAGTYLQGFESEMDFYTSNAMAEAQESEQENQNTVNGFGIYTANNSTKVKAVVDLYGLLSVKNSDIVPQKFITPQTPPFFMIYGEKDSIVPYKAADSFASELKNTIGNSYVEYILLPEAGHGGTIFDNQQLTQQIFAFLNRILFH